MENGKVHYEMIEAEKFVMKLRKGKRFLESGREWGKF